MGSFVKKIKFEFSASLFLGLRLNIENGFYESLVYKKYHGFYLIIFQFFLNQKNL